MKQKCGFTLFELLVAIFIGTILIMSGAYAIKTGLFSMGKEEIWFEDSTKERAAFDFFWQQVSSLYILKTSNKKNADNVPPHGENKKKEKEGVYFVGEKDFLVFVSPLSLKKHYSQGMMIANYKVVHNNRGKYDLVYNEFRVNSTTLHKQSEESENKSPMDKDNTVFFKDCDMISFAYFDKKEESNDEETIHTTIKDSDFMEGPDLTWKEKINNKIPQAVKLIVSKHGREQELISPIMVTYSSSVSGQ